MQKINWNNHELSKLCLGTVQFGLDYGIANSSGEISQENVNNILSFVINQNINCFDTGSMYGSSEKKIGNFVKENKKYDLNIISKIKSNFFNMEHSASISLIDKSLIFLSSESLFALLLHNIDAIKYWDEFNSELVKKLKKENKIKYFGVSIYTNEEFNFALENERVEIIQIPFSLLDQRAINYNWLKKAKAKNKLIFIRSIYLQGLILMNLENVPFYLENAKKYLIKVEEIANRLNITKNQLALSFVNQLASESILLFGCDTLVQARENIDNYNNLTFIDEEIIEELKKSMSTVDEDIYNPSKWIKQ